MDMLTVEHLSQQYGGLEILQDVSFSIEAGKKVALIGPNGAGKTTLLNVLSGLLPHACGRIFLDGHEITYASPHKRVFLGLGRSFQINSLFNNLTLIDNTLLSVQGTKGMRFQMLRQVTAYDDNYAQAQELLEPLDLWEKRYNPVNTLSHGEQRQVELILSLASRPKLLLLDEPNAGLSSGETATLITMIHRMVQDVTLFFSAHDMDLVFALADRVIVLYYGQIVAQGSPQEIQTDERVKAIYLGDEHGNA